MLKKLALFCLFLSHFTSVEAQESGKLQEVHNRTEASYLEHMNEKIYLHQDRSVYTTGETIWLKAYTTIGFSNLLSNHSQIAYIELINPKNEIVQSLRIPLIVGTGTAYISLADTLVAGSYRLRAYTQWMRNSDHDYFYERITPIANNRTDNTILKVHKNHADHQEINLDATFSDINGLPLKNDRISYQIIDGESSKVINGRAKLDSQGRLHLRVKNKLKKGRMEVNFTSDSGVKNSKVIPFRQSLDSNKITLFPEGGHLLSGVESRIAFKAVNSKGKGVPTTLYIINNEGDTISVSESNKLGMGSFSGKFHASKSYRAIAKSKNSPEMEVDFPKIQSSGLSLTLNPLLEKELIIAIHVGEPVNKQEHIYAMIQAGGAPIYSSKIPVSSEELLFKIPKNDFPSGVLQLTILNQELIPMAERLFFHVNPEQILDIKEQVRPEEIGKRALVNVDLSSLQPLKDNEIASLSASVFKTDANSLLAGRNILTELLLVSDIKGYIEEPGSYFNYDPPLVNTIDMDHLMLTQGFRKYNWDAQNNSPTLNYEVEKSLKIQGTVHKLGRKAVEPNATVTLISTHNFMDYTDTLSNEKGVFKFDKLSFPDSIKFLISAKNQKGRNNLDIKIDTLAPPEIGDSKFWPDQDYQVNLKLMDHIKRTSSYFKQLEKQGLMGTPIAIEEVHVTKRIRKAAEHSSNLNGAGNADQTLSADDLENCFDLSSCLSGKLTGVIFRGGIPYNTRSQNGGPMQVIIDGMYVEPDELSNILPSDVASIEVLRNIGYTAIYGAHGNTGVIIITSKRGYSARSNVRPRGLITHSPKGYHVSKEFYKPEYDNQEEDFDWIDNRNTIHWEPLIILENGREATFDFYTSDEPGEYIIQIEGISNLGSIVFKRLIFKVN